MFKFLKTLFVKFFRFVAVAGAAKMGRPGAAKRGAAAAILPMRVVGQVSVLLERWENVIGLDLNFTPSKKTTRPID